MASTLGCISVATPFDADRSEFDAQAICEVIRNLAKIESRRRSLTVRADL
jgi:hypothetical protein